MTSQPRRIDSLLAEALRGTKLAEGLERQGALTAWPQIVGAQVAQHSRAEALEDGILWVRVDSSVWAQELSLLERTIIRAFTERLGEGSVREIRFHSGRD